MLMVIKINQYVHNHWWSSQMIIGCQVNQYTLYGHELANSEHNKLEYDSYFKKDRYFMWTIGRLMSPIVR